MATIAVSNSKGGTGKTTTVRELAYQLAQDSRVLMVDLDPQASLSDSVWLPTPPAYSMANVFDKSRRLKEVIVDVSERLAIAVGHQTLTQSESTLRDSPAGHFALARALETVSQQFSFVLIDTIPTLSELNVNALIAAEAVIIPMQPQGTDVKALPKFLGIVNEVKDVPSAKLSRIGILPTQYNAQLVHHREVVEALKEAGYMVFSPVGRSVKVAEATARQKTLAEWDKDNPRVGEYVQLAKEVKEWLKTTAT